MVLDERTHKSAVSVGSGGGGKDGKEVVKDVSANNHKPMADKEGMTTLSMEVSTVGMIWSGVVYPCGM